MNKLAHFVYRLITGNKTNDVNLSKSEEIIARKLRPIINRDPDELAVHLSMPHVQAEEWLAPPPALSMD